MSALIKLSKIDIDWEALGLTPQEEKIIESKGIWTHNYLRFVGLVGLRTAGQLLPIGVVDSFGDTMATRNSIPIASYNLHSDGTNFARSRLNADFAQDARARDTISFSVSPVDVSLVSGTETALFSNSRNIRAPVMLQLRGDAAFTLTPRIQVGTQSWDLEDISVTTGFRLYALRTVNAISANLSGNLRGVQSSGATRTLTVGLYGGLP